MNLIILLLQIFVVLFLLAIFKSILKPPVFLSLVWLVPIAFLTFVELFESDSFQLNEYGLIFPLGCLVFSAGYSILDRKRTVINKDFVIEKRITIFFKFFILVEFIFVILWFMDVRQYVNANFKYNFWYTYKWGVSLNDYADPFYIPYLRTATRVISCLMFVNFLKTKEKTQRFWFLFQLFITLILNFLGQGRGGIFSLLLPLCIIYLLVNKDSRKKRFIIVSLVLVALISVFFIYGSMKDPYTVNADKSKFSSLENYLCGGIVSFCQWASKSHEYGNGIYTFRFIAALLNGLGFEIDVVSMVEEYVVNIHGNVGNVYTFYKWYANDFGILYSLIIQFILGVIYGWCSCSVRTKTTTSNIVFYALLFYPLFMQFFNDQYFSNFSIWIQIGFWIILFEKTNLFMISSAYKKEMRLPYVKI